MHNYLTNNLSDEKNRSLLFLLLLTPAIMLAKTPNGKKVLEEGKKLYRLEKAAWYATDDMREKHPERLAKNIGYVSYETKKGVVNTVFFAAADSVMMRYQFAALPDKGYKIIDKVDAKTAKQERELLKIRQEVIKLFIENEGRFFAFYSNTAPNIIPIIEKNKRKAYVLTGPQTTGYILLGNDYLLTFDADTKVKQKQHLHHSLIKISCSSYVNGKQVDATGHSHKSPDIMTSTDICTLLLYKDSVDWTEHSVISSKYVSTFNTEKQTLVIITTEE